MTISFQLSRTIPDEVEVIGVGVFADRMEDEGVDLDWAFLAQVGFEGKCGEVRSIPGEGAAVKVVIGMGPVADVEVSTFRRAAACLARAAARQRSVATTMLELAPAGVDPAMVAQALAEGFVLGTYRYNEYKSDPKQNEVESVAVVGGGGKRVQASLDRGALIADAVCFARDLVNEPGGSMTPRKLAQAAFDLAEREGLAINVLDEVDIEAARLGGLLGVNRGSTEPPRFIELRYEPDRPRGTVALVGKGITFDSGGLSLKTADSMQGMKGDMGGAAAVLGAFAAVKHVAPKTRVLGFIPVTDNMPGGDATRVGDVLKIRNGKTVEVLNTDAEGRLILADGLSMASEEQPDAIVDLATLTGACMVALGERTAGLMGNHRGWIDQVRDAADVSGEPVWPLPLPDHIRPKLDSDIADLKNITGTRHGGALAAGLFLREFVGEGIPWAHLDIAGPSDSTEDDPELGKGATGFGVRTLLQLLATFTKPKPSAA
jgi:leucyl aminopeptidase